VEGPRHFVLCHGASGSSTDTLGSAPLFNFGNYRFWRFWQSARFSFVFLRVLCGSSSWFFLISAICGNLRRMGFAFPITRDHPIPICSGAQRQSPD
jgi:hypothetical protein